MKLKTCEINPLYAISYTVWNLIRFFQLYKVWNAALFVLLCIYFTSIVQIVCYRIEVPKYVLVKQILRYKNSAIALLLIDTDINNYIKYDHMYTTTATHLMTWYDLIWAYLFELSVWLGNLSIHSFICVLKY